MNRITTTLMAARYWLDRGQHDKAIAYLRIALSMCNRCQDRRRANRILAALSYIRRVP